jgi:hypothetical protein
MEAFPDESGGSFIKATEGGVRDMCGASAEWKGGEHVGVVEGYKGAVTGSREVVVVEGSVEFLFENGVVWRPEVAPYDVWVAAV